MSDLDPVPPPPPDGPGGPVATTLQRRPRPSFTAVVEGRLSDLVTSVHDPFEDLFLPSLSAEGWKALLSCEKKLELAQAIVAWQGVHEARKRLAVDGKDVFRALQTAPEVKKLDDFGRRAYAVYLALLRKLDIRDFGSYPRPPQDPDQAGKPPFDAPPLPNDDVLSSELARIREDKDFQHVRASATLFLSLIDLWRPMELSEERDLRTAWFEVRDQKRTAGCVGWAVADLLWRQSNAQIDIPSARYIWHGAKEMDGEKRPTTFIAGAGTSLRAAMHLVCDTGYALESELSSESTELYTGSISQFYAAVEKRKVGYAVNLGRDLKCWLKWLQLGRPIVCSIWVGRPFAEVGADGRIGPYDPREDGLYQHAVLLAGYRAPKGVDLRDVIERSEQGQVDVPISFLVRNSRGTSWGDRGYAWMTYQDLRHSCYEGYGYIERDWPALTNILAGEPGVRPQAV